MDGLDKAKRLFPHKSVIAATRIFQIAAIQGKGAVVEFVAKQCPKAVNAVLGGNSGQTVLHDVEEVDQPDMVRLLLQLGANKSARTENGETPLGMARKLKLQECVDNLEVEIKEGMT